RSLNADISPKPTIFLPSIAERRLHDAGTYLCLLEDFFPDVIKIDWKEKDGKTILKSQQGDTIKTKDTYMKFSWLTVTGVSLDKEHKCTVKHEWNKGGVDQEILFPSQKKGSVLGARSPEGKQDSLRHYPPVVRKEGKKCIIHDLQSTLQLQLTNTSAYYTYVVLLLKSLVYSAITAVCLLRRPALCGNGKSS
ncbi:hypothetical protein PANDA_021752, partial [Ailuropoda melanoleuca]